MTDPKPDVSVLLPDDATIAARRDALTAAVSTGEPGGRVSRRPRSALPLLGAASAVVVVAGALLLASGASESPVPVYGAQLVRFAESTPLLLLEGPGWRVQNVYEAAQAAYQPRSSRGEGSMEFVTGKPVPFETIRVTGNDETGQHESGMLPAAVRQRKVELRWRHGNPGESLAVASGRDRLHGRHWITIPVLGTTAHVDTHAGVFVNQGGPGDRQMTAFWTEDGYVLELSAAVPDLAAFEERLGWLSKVGSQAWLDAMPEKVVKAADHDAVVREMLKGIPVPGDFKPSLIPGSGITTDRSEVSASVANTVSCLWFRQWGKARRTGNHASRLEAERAMATARRWPVLRQMAKEGGRPLAWELAADMPSGRGRRGWRLLPQAEALGCAREGIPVLPWKQRLQQERRLRDIPST